MPYDNPYRKVHLAQPAPQGLQLGWIPGVGQQANNESQQAVESIGNVFNALRPAKSELPAARPLNTEGVPLPSTPEFAPMGEGEIGQRAGAAANREAGAPPPFEALLRRRRTATY